MSPVSQTDLVADHRFGGVNALDIPGLDLGRNLNLTANDMVDLRRHGTTVNDENYPS